MERKIVTTADGSTTIQLPAWNEQYHSKHGAIQEAKHVFIKNGFGRIKADEISVLEIGFGTGLNALITYLEADKTKKQVSYTGIEAYPVSQEELTHLNYAALLNTDETVFTKLHKAPWEETYQLNDSFCLTKLQRNIEELDFKEQFDLLYFDAFGPRVQPELWTTEIFQKMYNALQPEGLLTTYCAKGAVRRSMQEVGFKVERTPGPPGKREMLVAIKPV